MEYFVP